MEAVIFVAAWLQIWVTVRGYETGAPTSVCGSMLPGHGVNPQSKPTPYEIETSSNGTFSTNQSITVFVEGPEYAGLLLMARTGSSQEALGTWENAPANTKIIKCSGNSYGAITHSNANPKNNLTVFKWMPQSSHDTVFFIATVLKTKTVFWVNVKSPTLDRVGPASAADSKIVTPTPLLLPILMSALFQH